MKEVDNLRSERVTEEEILQMLTFLECVVLSSNLYIVMKLFSFAQCSAC